MCCNYIVICNTRYSKTLDSWVKCMNGTESRAQNFGLYHYQGGFLNHIPPPPNLTYSCIVGEKVREIWTAGTASAPSATERGMKAHEQRAWICGHQYRQGLEIKLLVQDCIFIERQWFCFPCHRQQHTWLVLNGSPVPMELDLPKKM